MTEELVKKHIKEVHDGNTEALELLVDAFKPFRYKLAQGFMNRGIDPDDIMQQVDLEFIESIYRYDFDANYSAIDYITTSTRLNMNNFYRREMNFIMKNIPTGMDDTKEDEFTTDVQEQVESNINISLSTYKGDLTDDDRRIIYMRATGSPYREIAEHFGMSETTVKRRVYKLREEIGNFF